MVTNAQWLLVFGITAIQFSVLKTQEQNEVKEERKKAQSIRDLFKTGSCIPPPFTCPHPNMLYYLYTRYGWYKAMCLQLLSSKTLSCDHTKVTPYFIESINSRVGFWAGPCPNLFSYLIGWCEPKDTEYVLMGEHVTHKARGVYYVTTNANPPYARGFPGKARRLRSVSPYS
ncbi:jg4357 [Pararge aegeria aegeria]|uniref:Jg4357 protein n=1 Tax=Pararge aegeria aegeria TaxID=348720 RepID=A0A8S4RNJ4_9NEOP|nr:jg4357 [Pararge aegeria aegeria]